jgi:hypothetical protein
MVWWGSINCHIQAVTTAYYHLLCALSACHNLFIHTSSTIFKYGTADIYLKHGGHATQNSAHTASACPRALSHKTVFIVLGRWGHRHCRACLIKQLADKINFVSSAVTTARYNQYETGCGLYACAVHQVLRSTHQGPVRGASCPRIRLGPPRAKVATRLLWHGRQVATRLLWQRWRWQGRWGRASPGSAAGAIAMTLARTLGLIVGGGKAAPALAM